MRVQPKMSKQMYDLLIDLAELLKKHNADISLCDYDVSLNILDKDGDAGELCYFFTEIYDDRCEFITTTNLIKHAEESYGGGVN